MTFKAQILVDIPNGWEVACNEMREPKATEYFLDSSDHSHVLQAKGDMLPGEKRVIVKKTNPVIVKVHLPKGWRLGDDIIRQPFHGEWYLSENGTVYQQHDNYNWVTGHYIILQKEGE